MARKKKSDIKAPPRYVECLDGKRLAVLFAFGEGAVYYGIDLGHTGCTAPLFAAYAEECKDISEEVLKANAHLREHDVG